MASSPHQVPLCDLTGPPWAPDVSCHSELPSLSYTFPSFIDPSPEGRLWVLSEPLHLTLPPAHLPKPHLQVQPPDSGHPRLQERLQGRRRAYQGFQDLSNFPGLKVASRPP